MTDRDALDLRIADALDAIVGRLDKVVSILERALPAPRVKIPPVTMRGEFHEAPKDMPPLMNSGIPAYPEDL